MKQNLGPFLFYRSLYAPVTGKVTHLLRIWNFIDILFPKT